jgi:aryl-alcohol dehydrogenase-like predicted oxidoreductase
MAPKLCLGTASFGLSYGITNVAGKIPEYDARNILSYAESAGIVFLDCAQGYG